MNGREDHHAAEPREPSSANRIWLEVAILASNAGAERPLIRERSGSALWTVLIVAPDPDMRRYIQECLAEARLWLFAAADLESGLASLARARPNLVILDESVYRIQTPDAQLPDALVGVPVLLLAPDETTAASTRPDGCPHAAILAGPFNARRLREKVARCLTRGV